MGDVNMDGGPRGIEGWRGEMCQEEGNRKGSGICKYNRYMIISKGD